LGVAGIFACMSFVRNRVWADDFTLISSDMPHLENCARAHYYYATELNEQLQEEGWNAHSEQEMIAHYRRSMELSDHIYFGRLELATYYLNHEAPADGEIILKEMTSLFPKAADPFYFLGQRNVQTENYPEAVRNLEKCLQLAPRSHDAVYLLSISYGKTGKPQQGLDLVFQGLNTYPEARGNMYDALGHIYFDMGNMQSSVEATLTSIQFGRDPYVSYATVIGRFQSVGDSVSAMRYYQDAINRGIMQAPTTPGQ
jgi:tetratricopeptide (TPR) repeat protein